MSAPPILDVSGLGKRFGSIVAASEIDVKVMAGERIGLIGTNGAGKTTFVNMVTGYLTPDTGTIRLAGRDITGLPPRTIVRNGVCRSFQVPQLFLSMTAEQNLITAIGIGNGAAQTLFASPSSRQIRDIADALLTRFRLEKFRDQVASEMAGGVRKLLDIAMAVTRAPTLLLLDEPTSGVAADQKFELMDIIMEALSRDVTVLFVEHDMDIVERYAMRVLAFYEGTVIADGAPKEVLSDEKVRRHITGVAGGAPC
jgi:branched-chain amino acid transport system ATP-binding protein